MKLGPETRRQVGDNYEHIIFQLLKDFGWKIIRQNFETDVPLDIRKSGMQGGDGTFSYFDPLLNYDIGVYVESKKCKNLELFEKNLSQWLHSIDSMLDSLDTQIFSLPFGLDHVRVQEGLLSTWIDEDFDELNFSSIITPIMKEFSKKTSYPESFAKVAILSNNRLLQLQAVITQLYRISGKYKLSGYYQFVYPKRGYGDAPNLMMLSADYLFISTLEEEKSNHYHLVAFHLGESSIQQVRYFVATLINTMGQLIQNARKLHLFIWDFPPSEPSKKDLWVSFLQNEIENTYKKPEDFVSFEGFNPKYPKMSV